MNDQQFDRLIKASLSWQADHAIAQQPMRLAVRRLAVRLGGSPARGQSTLNVNRLPLTLSLGQTVVLALLLAILVLGALVVGASLLERPFGIGAACDEGRVDGDAMMIYSVGVGTTYLYPEGQLFTDVSAPTMAQSSTPPRADIVRGTAYVARRLTARGVELMLGRVTSAGLTEGCHYLRSRQSSGSVIARLPGGVVGADWSPTPGAGLRFAREVTAAEEARLANLADDLADPARWLPPEAWALAGAEVVQPEEWRVLISFSPTGLGPTDVLPLRGGETLAGSDPRYESILLPGGVAPDEFGEDVGTNGPDTYRCDLVTRVQALALAESIDALGVGYHSVGDGWMREGWAGGLFTSDLAQAVTFSIEPLGSFPGVPEASCDLQFEPESSPDVSPRPTPVIVGDLADVDPCSLVPANVEGIRGPQAPTTGPSGFALDTPARACRLKPENYIAIPISVTLYPRSLDRESARKVVGAVLGPDLTAEHTGQVTVWGNQCFANEEPCVMAVAISAEPYLILIRSESWFPQHNVRRLADAIVDSLSD